jgi:Protein of unknown function (DUF2786)
MTTQREGLLDKIRALLAKTVGNGCTEAEALAALAKARAIMDAYAVEDDELTLTQEEKAILRREPADAKDPHKIKQYLATSVAEFCECTAWRDCEKRLVFCGLRPDAQLATWLLDTLAAFVQAEIANHLMGSVAEGRHRRQVIASFALGCTSRISQRLDELCKRSSAAASSNTKALVVAKGAAVRAKLDELGIKLRSSRSSCGIVDDSSYAAGKAAGDRAAFGRPVSGHNATLQLR